MEKYEKKGNREMRRFWSESVKTKKYFFTFLIVKEWNGLLARFVKREQFQRATWKLEKHNFKAVKTDKNVKKDRQ